MSRVPSREATAQTGLTATTHLISMVKIVNSKKFTISRENHLSQVFIK